MPQEVELKFRLAEPAEVRRRLRELGFSQTEPRRREVNYIFDTPANALRRADTLLRLRDAAGHWTLTSKGPRRPGPFKSRREIETALDDGPSARALLTAIGFELRLTYRRFRTTFHQKPAAGELAWDETPMGVFLELEGSRAWIRRAATGLGLRLQDADPRSYPAIYAAWQAKRGKPRAPKNRPA